MTESCCMDIARLVGLHSVLTGPNEMSQQEDFGDSYSEEDTSRAGKCCPDAVRKYRA